MVMLAGIDAPGDGQSDGQDRAAERVVMAALAGLLHQGDQVGDDMRQGLVMSMGAHTSGDCSMSKWAHLLGIGSQCSMESGGGVNEVADEIGTSVGWVQADIQRAAGAAGQHVHDPLAGEMGMGPAQGLRGVAVLGADGGDQGHVCSRRMSSIWAR